MFLAAVWKNYRGRLLTITNIFGGGRKISVLVLERSGGKGWFSTSVLNDLKEEKGGGSWENFLEFRKDLFC